MTKKIIGICLLILGIIIFIMTALFFIKSLIAESSYLSEGPFGNGYDAKSDIIFSSILMLISAGITFGGFKLYKQGKKSMQTPDILKFD